MIISFDIILLCICSITATNQCTHYQLDNVGITIISLKSDSILFEVNNMNSHSIEMADPECLINLRPLLKIDSTAVPFAKKYKINSECVNRLVAIESMSKKLFKVKKTISELYSNPKGEGSIELEFYGSIHENGRIIKNYGSVLKSNSIKVTL